MGRRALPGGGFDGGAFRLARRAVRSGKPLGSWEPRIGCFGERGVLGLADALGDFMETFAKQFPEQSLSDDIRELKLAVGLEEHESTTDNSTDEDKSSAKASSHA